ncbi:hypothetical protein [Prevotella nigrescens]|uniref:hypothetical protein n=1 Tax=Prevotella nigrescens TaxID=28133 RepID=UPI002011DA7C|nr:hypothetical protein [Prevotella nigrescens]
MDRNNTTNILLKGIVILIVPAIAIVALGKIGLTEAQAIFIVGVFTVITAANQIRASNKKTFINTITIARKEYIATLRKVVSEFCASAESKNNNNTRLIELSYHLKMVLWAAIGIVLTILSLFSAFFFMDRFQRWEKGNK